MSKPLHDDAGYIDDRHLDRVRCKFKLVSVTRRKSWRPGDDEIQTLEFQPVGGEKSEENKAFWEATPSGKIEFGTVNATAAAMFELDSEYYVDFTPAPKA